MITTALLASEIVGRIRSTHHDQIVTDIRAIATFLSTPTGTGKVVFNVSPEFETSITTPSISFDLLNTTATTINFAGIATTLNIGAVTGTTTVRNNLVVSGDLVVNGTTVTVNTTNLDIKDKNITLASGNTTDDGADGGGITLVGLTNKTILWNNTNSNWDSNQNFNLDTGKVFKINNVSVLSGTSLGLGITGSSLTSVGTLIDLTVTNQISGSISGTSSNVRDIVSITNGGTGASSSSQALTNLLPAGTTSGYVLKTSGPGSFYWAAESGGAGAVTGTRINSSRLSYVATASQTIFTTPSYTVGASQLRVYINGVRQFDSEYTETDSTTVTFLVGLTVGDLVLIEVDGYIDYTITANVVTVSPVGTLASTDVQSALAELDSEKLALAGGTLSGLLQLSSGTTTSAAMKFSSGVVLTTPESGAIEWNGTNLFISNSSLVRKTLAYTDWPTFTGQVSSVGATPGFWYNETDGSVDAKNWAMFCSAGSFYFQSIADSGAAIGNLITLNRSGDLVALGNITAYSDQRVKTNIQTIENALAKVNNIRGVSFDRTDITSHQIGVIAQEIRTILPEVVFENPDGNLSVAYGNIVAVLIEAIKELAIKVNILENK